MLHSNEGFLSIDRDHYGKEQAAQGMGGAHITTLNKERASIQNVENFQSSRIFKNGKVVEWASHKTGCPN